MHEQKQYECPEVVIEKIEQLDEERRALLEELKEMLLRSQELMIIAEPEPGYNF